MFKKIWDKICGIGRWFKRWWKEITAATILATVAVTSIPAPTILSFSIDGQIIEVAYTDDNTDEDLIIRTNQKDYFNFGGNITVYFSVLNSSNKDQNIKTVFSFQDSFGDKKYVKNIEEYVGEITIEHITPAYWKYSTEYSTASDEYIDKETFIATTTQQIETTLWKEHTPNSFDALIIDSKIIRKDIKNTHSLKESTFSLAKGETKLFKAKIAYTDFKDREEFFIEAFGSLGAYGHLDPWTYEQLFNDLNTADLNTQDSFSGSVLFDVQISVRYEGAKAVSVLPAAQQTYYDIERAISNVNAGTVYFTFRGTDKNSRNHFQLSESGVTKIEVWFAQNTASNNVYINGGSQVSIGTWTTNTWYVVAIEFDDVGQPDKFRAKLYSSESWGSWTSWITGISSYTNIDKIKLKNYVYSQGGTLYWDTITPNDPTVVAAEEVIVPEFEWF